MVEFGHYRELSWILERVNGNRTPALVGREKRGRAEFGKGGSGEGGENERKEDVREKEEDEVKDVGVESGTKGAEFGEKEAEFGRKKRKKFGGKEEEVGLGVKGEEFGRGKGVESGRKRVKLEGGKVSKGRKMTKKEKEAVFMRDVSRERQTFVFSATLALPRRSAEQKLKVRWRKSFTAQESVGKLHVHVVQCYCSR